jgi:hypothetical protein
MHPYSQVLQEFPEMTELQRQFNDLMGVAGEEKIQMAVRLGKAPTPYYSYRRTRSRSSRPTNERYVAARLPHLVPRGVPLLWKP